MRARGIMVWRARLLQRCATQHTSWFGAPPCSTQAPAPTAPGMAAQEGQRTLGTLADPLLLVLAKLWVKPTPLVTKHRAAPTRRPRPGTRTISWSAQPRKVWCVLQLCSVPACERLPSPATLQCRWLSTLCMLPIGACRSHPKPACRILQWTSRTWWRTWRSSRLTRCRWAAAAVAVVICTSVHVFCWVFRLGGQSCRCALLLLQGRSWWWPVFSMAASPCNAQSAPQLTMCGSLQVVRLLGVGGFGEVYLCKWHASDVAGGEKGGNCLLLLVACCTHALIISTWWCCSTNERGREPQAACLLILLYCCLQ
jgi:hypothetical protein